MSFQFDPRPPNPRDLDYALLASRSLVAALRVPYLRVIRYLARQADE